MKTKEKTQKLYTEEMVESIRKEELQDTIREWHESKFQKPLINILRERMR